MEFMIFIEVNNGKAVNASLELLGAAAALSANVNAVLVGSGIQAVAEQVACLGAKNVTIVEADSDNEDSICYVLQTIAQESELDAILFAATAAGKDLAPRLAARLDTACVTDAIALSKGDNGIIFTRPAYGGNVLEHMSMNSFRPQIATVRSGSYKKPDTITFPAPVVNNKIIVPSSSLKARIVDTVQEISETVNLEEAQVIVAGGRGMGSLENFKLVEDLAALLGGVVGVSRPAIDNGWASRAHQVGQSGKIVAPKLYIACGISGVTQHVSGMTGSDYIVAINKDKDAPIFDIANVGIVGNAMDIIPLMIEEIKKLKAE